MRTYITKILALPFILFAFASCEWQEMEPVTELPENVSFKVDVMPIFNESCNMSGCHPSGGIPPDLSEESGYQNLLSLDMVDTLAAEESILYKRMIDVQKPMPTSGILSPSKTNLILIWIQEGARDN